jgi:hypothetical protein
MFSVEYKAKTPETAIATDEMFHMIDQHTKRLNPIDRAEKIERMIYIPEIKQRYTTPATRDQFGGAYLDTGEITTNVTDVTRPHGAGVVFGNTGDSINPRLERPFELRDTAWHQLCGRIKPAPYFRQNVEKMPPRLRHLVVNHFLQERSKNEKLGDRMMLFRSWEPEFAQVPVLRALVTSDYIKLDDNDVLEYLRQCPEAQDARVRHFKTEEKNSVFKLFWPNKTVELKNAKRGDALCYGVQIVNSEVGSSSVQIYGSIDVLSCVNGMTRTDMFCKFVHRGNREVKLRMIGESVREAAQKTDHLVNDIRQAIETQVEDPFKAIENFTEAFGWTDEFKERVQTSFAPDFGGTLFDVTQAVTAAAQAYDGKARFDLEKQAGDALTVGLRAA